MLFGMFGGPALGPNGGNGIPLPPGSIIPPWPGGAPKGGGGIPVSVSTALLCHKRQATWKAHGGETWTSARLLKHGIWLAFGSI